MIYVSSPSEKIYHYPQNMIDIKVFTFSLSYYFFDTLAGVKFGYNSLLMVIHHLVMLVLVGDQLLFDKFKYLLGIIYAFGEMSTIFLMLFENFSFYKRTQKLSDIFGFIFCIIFLVNRILILTPLYYYILF